MNKETETPKPADVAGRLDGLVSAKILWRWKHNAPCSFTEGWVKEVNGQMLLIADHEYGRGLWREHDEIEFRVVR